MTTDAEPADDGAAGGPEPRASTEPLRARILRWLAPLRELRGGFQLDECETEQGITLLFRDGPRRLVIELERADGARPASPPPSASTSTTRASAGRTSSPTSARSRALVALLRDNETEVTLTDLSAVSRRMLVREIEVDRASSSRARAPTT